jgi:hypothetical protein
MLSKSFFRAGQIADSRVLLFRHELLVWVMLSPLAAQIASDLDLDGAHKGLIGAQHGRDRGGYLTCLVACSSAI